MYVEGWAIKLALAPRPLMIYCAWGRVISPAAYPEPGGPGTTLRLAPTLCPVWHKWPYQELTLTPA
jgi:hypothetical protein